MDSDNEVSIDRLSKKSWNAADKRRIRQILDRILNMEGDADTDKVFSYIPNGLESLEMDLVCTHNEVGLDFQKLLIADDFNFLHDIVGIQYNIDRPNECLCNHFLPRCTVHQGDA